eukprot:2173624-Rhodomonas_salina.2
MSGIACPEHRQRCAACQSETSHSRHQLRQRQAQDFRQRQLSTHHFPARAGLSPEAKPHHLHVPRDPPQPFQLGKHRYKCILRRNRHSARADGLIEPLLSSLLLLRPRCLLLLAALLVRHLC